MPHYCSDDEAIRDMKRNIREYLKGKKDVGIDADIQLKIKRNKPDTGYAVGEVGNPFDSIDEGDVHMPKYEYQNPKIKTGSITMPKIKAGDITIPKIKSGNMKIPKIVAGEMEIPNVRGAMGKGVGEMPTLKIKAAEMKGIAIKGEDIPNIGKLAKKIDAER